MVSTKMRKTFSPWHILLGSLIIALAIMGAGWLSFVQKHLAATLSAPLWMAMAIPVAKIVITVLIITLMLFAPKGKLSAVLIILFNLLPSIVALIPGGYLELQFGMSPALIFLLQTTMIQLYTIWFAASIIALVRALRPIEQGPRKF